MAIKTINFMQTLLGKRSLEDLSHEYADSLRHLHVHIYWKDQNGKYIDANERMVKACGFNHSNDLIGAYDKDFPFFSDHEKSILRANDTFVMTSDKPLFCMESVSFADGVNITAFSHKAPFRLHSKRVIGVVGFSLIVNNHEAPALMTKKTNHCLTESLDSPLTKRQTDCIILLSKGLSMKQIADALSLSPRTVQHYLEAIKEKLNCYSRSELIAKALQLKCVRDCL